MLTNYLDKEGWNKASEYVGGIIDLIDTADANGVKIMGIDDDRYNAPSRRHDVNSIWAQHILDVTGGNAKFLILAGNGHSANYPKNKGVDVLLKIPSFDYNDSKCILHTTKQETDTVVRIDGRGADFFFRMG